MHKELEAINAADSSEVASLTASINALQTAVTAKAESSALNSYASNEYVNNEIEEINASLQSKIASVQAAIPSLEGYTTNTALAEQKQELIEAIENKTTIDFVSNYVSDVLEQDNYLTQSYLDESLSNLSENFLTYSGGTLRGSLKVNKLNLSDPAVDFSETAASGSPAFKFATQNPNTNSYSTFGTTDNFWEYAWKFNSHEDFCWIYGDTNKVFSITKEGPACSTLYLGDRIDNDINGRTIHNKIDLKERLNTYQTAFENLRQGVSSANDFNTLKSSILTALASV